MNGAMRSKWWLPLLSAVLTFAAMCGVNFWLSWICYIPFFISIRNVSPRAAFRKGLLLGGGIAFIAFFWMIAGAGRFTGHSIVYGMALAGLSIIFLSLYHGSLVWLFALLIQKKEKSYSLLINALLAASVITVAETWLRFISDSMPWFGEHSGTGLSANLYSIQPAAFFGVHILSFVVVVVNYIAAYFISEQAYPKLYIPIGIVLVYMLAGWWLFHLSGVPSSGKPVTVAIIAENIPPEEKWDEHNGDQLVGKLLALNREATAMHPDIILWSESGIPWTYQKDDDLVLEVLKITAPAQSTHILGINTPYSSSEVYNSAYGILPDGQVCNRYDKQQLLAFVEKPIGHIAIPFVSSSGFTVRTDQQNSAPLHTPYGKAGVLICNESAVATAAADKIKQGAVFLCNMSNDGWFSDSYITRDHFFNARLRAVESRKDMVVNSNNGYSGLIKSTGEVLLMKKQDTPFVETVVVEPNSYITTATLLPDMFSYGCTFYLLVILVFALREKAGRKLLYREQKT